MAKVEDLDIARLCQSIQQSRLALAFPRQIRVDMVKQYVGRYYSVEGVMKPVPVNLMAMYVQIVGQKLIAANPRFMFSTWDMGNRPTIATMERWANKQVVKMRLANTIARVVTDAFFAFGITKVGLATPADAAMVGWKQRAGRPFACRIDFDDWVHDAHARDISEAGFMGHRFRVPLRVIRDSKVYSKERKNLGPMPDKLYNLEGDERIGTLGRTTMAGDEEFEDCIDLWEIYLPRHQLVLTLQHDAMTSASTAGEGKNRGKALRIQRWIGPDSGPYHVLGFGVVPGNSRPKAPLQDLFDLHMSINGIVRKLMRQAQRCKEILAVGGGHSEDGDKVRDLSDGDVGQVSDVSKLETKVYGTPNPQLFQLFTAFKDLFSWLSGNLEIMGGLSPQGKTASQDQLMNQNASATISIMQQRVLDHVADIGMALSWYWHHNPYEVMRSEFQVPGSKLTIPTYSTPQSRQRIPFEDIDITIDPYSLQHQTPQSRMQTIQGFITQVFAPMAQLFQQQGVSLDINTLTELFSKYMDQPDFPTLFTTAMNPAGTQNAGTGGTPDQGQGMGGNPAETTRTYERRSTGGDTTAGRAQQVSNAMEEAASSRRNGTPQPVS